MAINVKATKLDCNPNKNVVKEQVTYFLAFSLLMSFFFYIGDSELTGEFDHLKRMKDRQMWMWIAAL